MNSAELFAMFSTVLFTSHTGKALQEILCTMPHDRLFVLTDCHTLQFVESWGASVIDSVGAGEEFKNIQSVCRIWDALSQGGATRHSVLINLGGGMVSDLGGFAAATYKRGIRTINIPTTLLSMVDAALGGKTGFNRQGIKNEIGAFHHPEAVIVNTNYLTTLDAENMWSGYAEMIKHGLIASRNHWEALIRTTPLECTPKELEGLVRGSMQIKQAFVDKDPTERGIRKALNFGHTLGHALETLSFHVSHPLLHGCAVAWGMVGELYESLVRLNFPKDVFRQTVQYIRANYAQPCLNCEQYDYVWHTMQNDKKNEGREVRCVLLNDIAQPSLNQPLKQDDVFEMLDFIRDGQ